jgi:hypothetical protein
MRLITGVEREVSEPKPEIKRWYDSKPGMSRALKMLERFPESVVQIVAEGVLTIAHRDYEISQAMKSLRSLGPDRVMGLYKSKQRRRTYDACPSLHRAVNTVYVLSDERQKFLISKMNALIDYTITYLKDCQAFEVEPSEDNLAELVNTYVESGPAQAEKLLDSLRQTFMDSLNHRRMVIPKKPEQQQNTILTSRSDDLQVKERRQFL